MDNGRCSDFVFYKISAYIDTNKIVYGGEYKLREEINHLYNFEKSKTPNPHKLEKLTA